jgi:hypothetical protein
MKSKFSFALVVILCSPRCTGTIAKPTGIVKARAEIGELRV